MIITIVHDEHALHGRPPPTRSNNHSKSTINNSSYTANANNMCFLFLFLFILFVITRWPCSAWPPAPDPRRGQPTPNLLTKTAWLKLSGNFPVGLGIPPLSHPAWVLPESNPLKSRILVRRFAVPAAVKILVPFGLAQALWNRNVMHTAPDEWQGSEIYQVPITPKANLHGTVFGYLTDAISDIRF